MKRVVIDINQKVDRRDTQIGKFTQILILNERDLKDIDIVLYGYYIELIYVPRELTEEEKRHIMPYLNKDIGRIINYND